MAMLEEERESASMIVWESSPEKRWTLSSGRPGANKVARSLEPVKARRDGRALIGRSGRSEYAEE